VCEVPLRPGHNELRHPVLPWPGVLPVLYERLLDYRLSVAVRVAVGLHALILVDSHEGSVYLLGREPTGIATLLYRFVGGVALLDEGDDTGA